MNFNFDKPIYRQIIDRMEGKIMRGEWRDGERIPAVRELAMEVQVNPNTVMRAYESLQSAGVIFNKRGVGFFISEGANQMILDRQRDFFMMYDLPEIFERMEILGIRPRDITERYELYKNSKEDENKQ